MISICRKIIASSLLSLITGAAFSVAPVVEESGNFSSYDQYAAADEQPLAHDSSAHRSGRSLTNDDFVDEQPLARESTRAAPSHSASLLSEVKSLQKEIQELRGQLELQGHELKLLKDQQLTFYKDLDARITKTPSAPSTPAPTLSTNTKPIEKQPEGHEEPAPSSEKVVSVSNSAAHSNNPADEQIQYLAAYDLVKTKRFKDAIVAMEAFVAQYPTGGYTANAHYWLGELYMTNKDYTKAITQFDTVLSKFPVSSKAAPSLLKSAYALASSGKKQEAIVRLKQVVKQHPDTHTAQLAEAKLKSLNR